MRGEPGILLLSVGLEFGVNDVILLNDAQNFSIFRWRSSYTSSPGMVVMSSGFEYGSPKIQALEYNIWSDHGAAESHSGT
jgi:hypothetical protein